MYWERDQEVTLLHLVLEAFDPNEIGATPDQIICGLIEMGLVDASLAPIALQAWQDAWDGFDVPYDFIAKHYNDDEEDEIICAHCDVEITTDGDGWVDDDGGTVCAQMSADGPTNRLHVPA